MRLLFQLPYPGYLRIYGSTVAHLVERGHTVLLAYDEPDKRRDPAARLVEELAGVETVPRLPDASRRLPGLVVRLRLAIDYLHYLGPAFAESPYLRRRMNKFLPGRLGLLRRLSSGSRLGALLLTALLRAERLVRADAAVQGALEQLAPTAIVASPVIGRGLSGVRQTDTVKAARALGIPVALAVTSWDHLTTKGRIKALPDRVFVWNDVQRREALDLHRVPAELLVTTGAQLFDQWFERQPSRPREELLSELGLAPDRPYVLYVGSSPNIAPVETEIRFVRDWLAALRSSNVELSVLVRPHPGNIDVWAGVDLGDPAAAIAPRSRPEIPMSDADEALYFDSIHHAAAVVGINTSAIIESLIQRRPVLTIRAHEFQETQEGTLHFHYLVVEGRGPVRAAATLAEHLVQLRAALADPDADRETIDRFLQAFVRPHGLDRPATAVLADAIEALVSDSR